MLASASRIVLPMSALGALLLGSVPGDTTGTESVTTLWANDELRSALSFDTGDYAVDIVDGQAVLDRAQIAFHLFEPNKLSAGFSIGQAFRVLDLGDIKVDGYYRPSDQTSHPPISIFHTLFLQGREIYYRGPLSRTYHLKDAAAVFFTLINGGSGSSFSPELGHTYLMRYAPRRESGAEEKLVKFRVVDFEPGRQVTIRWARMK